MKAKPVTRFRDLISNRGRLQDEKEGSGMWVVAKSGLLTAVLVFCLASIAAQAPEGRIVGTVFDQSGGAVPGASVTLESQNTGVIRTAVTGEEGTYAFGSLNPGVYRLTVEMTGFSKAVHSDIGVLVAQVVRLDPRLTIGETGTSIEVQGGAALIDTDTSDVSTVLIEEQVKGIPLNGREFSQLATLMPGVRPQGTTGGALITQFATAVQVGGTSEGKNSYSFDGVDNTFDIWNGPAVNPSIDAIQEFRIDRTMAPAEFGRGGAQVQLVTKSGTNDFHGALWEYHRNFRLNAGNYTSHVRDTVLRNQFGANLGGPVIQNKLFFFFNWESQREHSSVQPTGTVFTDKIRTGDLSEFAEAIRDPLTGQPFAGNVIPANRLDPVALAYMESMMPRQNLPGFTGNFIRPFTTSRDWDQYIGRVDFNASPKDEVFFRFSVQPRSGLNAPLTATSIPATEDMDFYNAGLGYTRSWTSTVVTETRVGFHREDLDMSNALPERLPSIPIQGLPPTQPPPERLPVLSISPFYTLAMWGYPWISTQKSTEFLQNASMYQGKHLIKAGFGARATETHRKTFGEFQINESFTGVYTGNGVADYLLGLPFTASENLPPREMKYNYGDISFYLQDDWKVTPNLTLNLGIRYEYFLTPRSRDLKKWSNFVPSLRKIAVAGDQVIDRFINPVVKDPWLPFLIPATATDLPNDTLSYGDSNNLSPRIGLAWRPFSNNRTVFRAGFGIFYLPQDGNLAASNGNGGAPYLNAVSTTNTTPLPTFTMGDPFAGGVTVPPPNPAFFDPNMNDSYSHQLVLGVQHELPGRIVAEANFHDQKSLFLETAWNINQPRVGTTGDLQARRPFPEFSSSINGLFHDGYARYDALELILRKRTAQTSFEFSHTWSKNIGRLEVINAYDRDLFPGPFDYVPHLTKFHFVADLPFGQGRQFLDQGGVVNFLAGGWTVSGIYQRFSGSPLTPTYSGDPANVGVFSARPTLNGDPTIDNPTPARWFDPSVFSAPAAGTFGNAGTGIIFGPSSWTADFGIYKRFPVPLVEGSNLQFRTEMFNAFNHPNRQNPVMSFNSPDFGRIITKNLTPRVIQFALRFEF